MSCIVAAEHPSQTGGPGRLAAGENRFLRRDGNSFASNDRGDATPEEELGVAPDEECRFEIFRMDQQRMTSTRFSGGDWRWRLVTSGGLVLAKASGYPNEATCRAAVAVLQARAAGAPVIARPGDRA